MDSATRSDTYEGAVPSATPFTHSELTSNVAAMCEDLRRTVARREAAQAADAEQEARVNRERGRAVFENMAMLIRRAHTAAAAEQERARRLEAPPPQFTQSAADLRIDIERRGNAAAADALMEQERAERIHADRLAAICEQLERTMARRSAANDADCEQETRVATALGRAVMAELQSRASRRRSAHAAKIEQSKRVASEADYWARRNGDMAAALDDIHTAIERRANAAAADIAMEDERAERIHSDRLAEVNEQIRRSTAQSTALGVIEDERAARIHCDRFYSALEDIGRLGGRTKVMAGADADRRRRSSAEFLPPDPKSIKMKQDVCASIDLGSDTVVIGPSPSG